MKTAFDYGYRFAQTELDQAMDDLIDVPKIKLDFDKIPLDDFVLMTENGIEIDFVQYWDGYNTRIQEEGD